MIQINCLCGTLKKNITLKHELIWSTTSAEVFRQKFGTFHNESSLFGSLNWLSLWIF